MNACLKEFTKVGYEKASTNEIIKEANISKGSLFSYFNSKKELYLFLLDYIIGIVNEIYNEVNLEETDIFKRIIDIGLVKYKIIKKYPLAFNLLKSLAQEESPEVKSEIIHLTDKTLNDGMDLFTKNIDFTKFRDDIDVTKAVNVIKWTILSFAEQQISQLETYENVNMDLLKEWDGYFDLLKCVFYKNKEN